MPPLTLFNTPLTLTNASIDLTNVPFQCHHWPFLHAPNAPIGLTQYPHQIFFNAPAEEGNGWNDEDLENKVIKKMTLNKGENFGLQRRLRWETWVRLNGRLWFHKLVVNAKWNFGRQVQIQRRRQCLKMKIEIEKRALSTKMTVNKRENFDWEKLSMENKVNGKLWFQKPSLNTKKILINKYFVEDWEEDFDSTDAFWMKEEDNGWNYKNLDWKEGFDCLDLKRGPWLKEGFKTKRCGSSRRLGSKRIGIEKGFGLQRKSSFKRRRDEWTKLPQRGVPETALSCRFQSAMLNLSCKTH